MLQPRVPAAAVFLAAFSSSVLAQAKPDFSGTWIVVTPAASAGEEETISQDTTTLVRSHGSSHGRQHSFTYKLDGSESRNVLAPHAGEQIVSLARAVWEGNTLTISEKVTYPNGRNIEAKSTLRFNDQGQLVMEVSETVDGKSQPPVTIVYRKK